MTPFDVSARLRELASQCENCDPTDGVKLEMLSDAVFDLAFEIRPDPNSVGQKMGELANRTGNPPPQGFGQAERVG